MFINLKCGNCGAEFRVPYKNRNKRTYCSTNCRVQAVILPRNVTLAQETAVKRGNTLRGRGEGKTYTKQAGKHQHVYVMELHLKRALRPGEVVHHLDGNKKNNNTANLELLSSQSEHANLHFDERRRDSKGRLI